MELRPCQRAAVDFCVDFFAGAARGARTVVAAPTGSGKSYVELEVQRRMGDGCWIVTPRLEIASGMLDKIGERIETYSELVAASFRRRIVTPVRFRNALSRGEIDLVTHLVLDEGHHATARTWEQLQLLCGLPPAVLLTATPFRGTQRGTAEFLAAWGEPTWMVKLREAAALGYISVPRCEVLPLVDDDEVTVTSTGEFDVSQVSSLYASRLEDLAQHSLRWVDDDGTWDRATVFSLPSVSTARELSQALSRRNAPCTVVHGTTPRSERLAAYELLRRRLAALAQVAVLGEGVDLPVRRLVDAAPKMSPVAWLQQFGRATRPVAPGEELPHYVATNRNISRHSYLLEGLVPSTVVALSDSAFGRPSKRGAYRALGLEALGRFRGCEVHLADGCTASFYALVSVTDGRSREYACLVHPAAPDPVWAHRVHGVKGDGSRDWGRWKRCDAPVGLQGFASVPGSSPTEKQAAWWAKSAEGRGLDPSAPATRKNFAILPFLFDLGISFRAREEAR